MVILIVDDSLMWAKVVQKTLSLANYQSDIIDNGTEAILPIIIGGYQLAIIDLKLPDINGIEVARIGRENGVKIPLFLISGDISLVIDSDKCLFDEIIQKPILPTDLISLVNKHTRQENRIPLPENGEKVSFTDDVQPFVERSWKNDCDPE